jgi:hypothetical protein
MDEKRHNQRMRVLKAGSIEFGGGAIDCVARNLSDEGAALDVASPLGIPEHFRLAIAHEPVRSCAVRWRTSGRIGVAFE